MTDGALFSDITVARAVGGHCRRGQRENPPSFRPSSRRNAKWAIFPLLRESSVKETASLFPALPQAPESIFGTFSAMFSAFRFRTELKIAFPLLTGSLVPPIAPFEHLVRVPAVLLSLGGLARRRRERCLLPACALLSRASFLLALVHFSRLYLFLPTALPTSLPPSF